MYEYSQRTGEVKLEPKTYLLALAIILLSTKLLGLATERVRMPQIVGALLAGLLLGPVGFGIIEQTDLLDQLAELGVIFLMFHAGMETNFEDLKKTWRASIIIAILGVILPLIGGTLVFAVFFGIASHQEKLEAIFTGVVLTATSVSITVEALREMGKLNTFVGSAILGAAIIDDILGIIVLTVVSGFADASANIPFTFGKIALYIVFLPIVANIVSRFFKHTDQKRAYSKRTAIYLLAFALFMAYVTETYFGIADITGAYFAGMMVCNIERTREAVSQKIDITSYLLFSPVFFASIGLKTDLNGFSSRVAIFCCILLFVAIITKVIGCGIGAWKMGFNKQDALCIGIGMVSRGEVALIVAQKGQAIGVLHASLFPAVVLMVVVTTVLSPVLLRFAYGEKKELSSCMKY